MGVNAADDLVHAPGPERLWREGFYFEFCDPATGRFGYANFGKLPNKGRAGNLVCLWDPEHGLLVAHERDTFESHTDAHRVGGLSVTCVKPLEEWHLSFDGEMLRLPRLGERRYRMPAELSDAERVTVPATFDVTWRAVSPAHAFDSPREEWRALFEGHFEQLGSSTGTLRAGDDAADARWVPPADVPDWPLTTDLAETLRSWGVL